MANRRPELRITFLDMCATCQLELFKSLCMAVLLCKCILGCFWHQTLQIHQVHIDAYSPHSQHDTSASEAPTLAAKAGS